MINRKFSLENVFQDILYWIDNWINEGSSWIIALIESQYINVSTYRPLSGSSYIKLPAELKSPKKGLTKRITWEDKKLVNNLDYDGVGFPVREKDFGKIEKNNYIYINVLCYENKLVFPIYVSDQKFENSMDLLLVIDENKSHYVYIKDFDRFMFHKTKNKNKKYFFKSCLQCFSSKNVLTEHKEVCLSINGAQSVRLGKGTIEFKNYFKQIKKKSLKFMLILSVI